MPRASRYLVEGHTYHLTHRCHDRRFLLKCARERDAYREWLRIGAQRYHVPVLGYCITKNHVHVLVHATNRVAVGQLMQLPASAVAQQINTRKGHDGSAWEHPYHCTMVEDGRHLLNCLRYIDLNMVRCGEVPHPDQWRWCGFDELTGKRKRYRILDIDRLLECLDLRNAEELSRLHCEGIREQIERRSLAREPHWTETIAVGGKVFINQARSLCTYRQTFAEENIGKTGHQDVWILKEAGSAYNADFASKKTI